MTRRTLELTAALVAAAASAACAQRPASGGGAPGAHEQQHAEAGAAQAMGGHGAHAAGPHIRLTPRRPAAPDDTARAAAVAAELRRAIARYADVKVAEAEGFEMFAPELERQRVYHFTNYRQAFKEHFRFDPAQPTSLLYRKDAAGRFVLVGAMFVAPKRATLADLDARVPLSVAQWHAHVNVCVPPRGERERWRETRGAQMKFGPAGAITTRRECDAEGGRFHEQLFGWMVHANVFDGDDPATVWGH